MEKFDYLVVGSGLYGAIFAHEAKAHGKSVLVVDKRPNIAGNIYTENVEGINKPNFQGNAAVNYTDRETPWTRIIEHKWFEFGKDENGNDLSKTIISREYSSEWKPGDEPYYPVNDAKNSLLYSEYKKLADAENKVIFGGRLGEYKYYDMDQVIAAVLDKCEQELGE